jgi:hypothetical protein
MSTNYSSQSRSETSLAASSSRTSSPNVRGSPISDPSFSLSPVDSGVISVEPYLTYAKTAALNKAAHPTWEQIYIRGIACNWLVCVAVWVCARQVPTEEIER